MIGLKNVIAQKTSVAIVRLMVMMLHGAHTLNIILDIQAIVSQWALRFTVLETSLLVIMMGISTHAIIVVLILRAALVINMIAETAIASHKLVTARVKLTMPNPATDPDQEHDCNQGPVLVILEPQDMIMVTIFMMTTTGERNRDTHPLLSLI